MKAGTDKKPGVPQQPAGDRPTRHAPLVDPPTEPSPVKPPPVDEQPPHS
jgi:hypothetical protein